MDRIRFDYEKYINFDETPYEVELNEDGSEYNIVVGFMEADLDTAFDKAGRSILKNVKFHIIPQAKKNKWEVVDYGKLKDLSSMNEYQRIKLEILNRQMPNFFKKYKEATPQQFALWARHLLRPMRDSKCRYKLNEIKNNYYRTLKLL